MSLEMHNILLYWLSKSREMVRGGGKNAFAMMMPHFSMIQENKIGEFKEDIPDF
jgi:hypothetical protein